MPMQIRHYSKPSPQKSEGEDALALNPHRGFYGVMDGVTPIADYRDANGHNGAYLASNILKAYLERPDGSGSLLEEVRAANRALREAMVDAGIDLSRKHELWASCLAVAHVTEEGVRFAQTGDCMIVAKFADGSVRVLTENRVNGVSARAKAKRAADRERGLPVEDESHYEELYNVLAYNRSVMANTPEGYGVANGTEEAAEHIRAGFVQASEQPTDLLLVSDGMFHPGVPLETTLEQIVQEGFETYVERVEAAERERGMRPDDRSAVLLQWR
ncbi:protein phosphatase 2C domain-containing protein [Paenibacillus flagellatus]|uniref:Serine/threonine protein phosphatase n=1 Tax=Paenibacillus flagellatus TaxID=2211139 RepID=A0A2V5KBX4_9BACL|nr:protein phosphatase 2C domain-containing protein [Paenibacillus flagellatus]PYI55423.1 serine/threonine protein phosphatase [Paenibacillus flagellatus]